MDIVFSIQLLLHGTASIKNKEWLMEATESDLKENRSKYIGFLSYLSPE